MGLFSGLKKIGGAIVGTADKFFDSTAGKAISTIVPGGALLAEGIGIADDFFDGGGGGGAPGLPPPPGGGGFASPSSLLENQLSRAAATAPSRTSGTLPAAPGAAGPEWYPITQAKTIRRCAPGYVKVDTVIDGNAVRVCMRKDAARARRLWRPARKPPISVKEANAIRMADRAIKKFQRFETKAKKIANWRSTKSSSRRAIPASYTVIDEGSGSANLKVISAGRKK